MKSMKLSLAILIMSALTFTSCVKDIKRGRGDIVTQERSVANFTKVKITGSTDVFITQGAAFKVTASDYDNLINELETSVTGDELRVGYKSDVWVTKGKSKVTVVMPALTSLTVEGSGDFTVTGPFTVTGRFTAKVRGSGDMNINGINATDITADINGSGDINMSGSQSKTIRVDIDGSGDLKAFGLQCDNADIDITGSGDTELSVAKQLDALIRGSGDVYYKGNPVVNATIHGSGRVVKR
jgi:Putative auto-transporter adhesin, head GIN domain